MTMERCIALLKPRLTLTVATVALAAVALGAACKSGDQADGSGGATAGSSGTSGGTSAGGSGVSNGGAGVAGGNGGQSVGGTAGMAVQGGSGGEPLPAFVPVIGKVVATAATLPIDISFSVPTDLSGKFKVFEKDVGTVVHDTQEGGRIKVMSGKQALAFYDTTPDETGTDGFSEFTASVTFTSAGIPRVGFFFGGDDKRWEGKLATLHFSNGVIGPPGVNDVNGFNHEADCSPQYWKVPMATTCFTPVAGAYGFSGARPDTTAFKYEITVKKAGDAAFTVYTAYYSGDTMIDHQVYTTAAAPRLTGELGIFADALGGDLFIDNFKVQAPKAIPDFKVTTFVDTAMTWFLWIPEGLTKVNGILHFYPTMMMPAGKTGEFALWDHYRRFAQAHGWALLSHYGSDDMATNIVASADLALVALATQSAHPEIKDAPVFVESLIDRFPIAFAKAHPEKTIGFALTKPAAATAAQVVPDATTYQVPGLFSYAPLSIISGLAGTSTPVKTARMSGALWAMVANGGQAHAEVDGFTLHLSFLQQLIALRMTAGSNVLKPLDKATGWLGETKPLSTDEFAVIRAYGSTDDPAMSWLPDEAFATVFSAFYYNKTAAGKFVPKSVFFTTTPLHGSAGESRTMRVGFADGFAWKKIEFLDMAQKKGEVLFSATAVPQFTYTALTKGAHTFIARVTDSADKVHLTHPVMTILSP